MESTIRTKGAGDSPEGRYANYFEIGHNAFEFILDFGQAYCEEPETRTLIHSRIVISPVYVRMFLEVLQQSVRQHGQRFGPILEEPAERAKDAAKGREPDTARVLKIIPGKII